MTFFSNALSNFSAVCSPEFTPFHFHSCICFLVRYGHIVCTFETSRAIQPASFHIKNLYLFITVFL